MTGFFWPTMAGNSVRRTIKKRGNRHITHQNRTVTIERGPGHSTRPRPEEDSIGQVDPSASVAHTVMALDVGRKRIGIAVGGLPGRPVEGLDTLVRGTLRQDFDALARLASQHHASAFVVGLPLHFHGEPSPMSERVRAFAVKLQQALGLPVWLHDERLTSETAEQILLARGYSRQRIQTEKRQGAVDRLAAILILEDWLEHHRKEATA